MTDTYPALSAAIETIKGMGSPPPDTTCRLRRAYADADRAYAAELLPAILGGEWIESSRHIDWKILSECSHLFDHARTFRRRFSRGPNTWKICAVLSHPYGKQEGGLHQPALFEAFNCLERGVGVWVRDDLSAYYPGWSRLVIASCGLFDLDPTQFGFAAIHDPHTQYKKEAERRLGW